MIRYENLKWVIIAAGIALLATIQLMSRSDDGSFADRHADSKPVVQHSSSTELEPRDHRTVSEWTQDNARNDVRSIEVDDIHAPVELNDNHFATSNSDPMSELLQEPLPPARPSVVTRAEPVSVVRQPTANGQSAAIPTPAQSFPTQSASEATETGEFVGTIQNTNELPQAVASANGAAAISENDSLAFPVSGQAKPESTQPVATKAPAPRQMKRFKLDDGVQTRVVHHIEYGKTLARRGAAFSAQREFYGALRLVAQAIDQQTGNKQHSDYLDRALRAFAEANDFHRFQDDVTGFVDVAKICETHSSRILDPKRSSSLSAPEAMQAYYGIAQEHLMRATGGTVVAAEAHYCLGKLHAINGKQNAERNALDFAKSVVHHSVALKADPNHYRSANELGVLLAQSGQLLRAKQVLKQSLRVRQLPETWGNLAVVHQRLGEAELADLARTELQRVLSGPPVEKFAEARIQWVSPESFSNPAPNQGGSRTAVQQPTANQPKTDGPISGFLKKLF